MGNFRWLYQFPVCVHIINDYYYHLFIYIYIYIIFAYIYLHPIHLQGHLAWFGFGFELELCSKLKLNGMGNL